MWTEPWIGVEWIGMEWTGMALEWEWEWEWEWVWEWEWEWVWVSVFSNVFVEWERHDLKQEHTYTNKRRTRTSSNKRNHCVSD